MGEVGIALSLNAVGGRRAQQGRVRGCGCPTGAAEAGRLRAGGGGSPRPLRASCASGGLRDGRCREAPGRGSKRGGGGGGARGSGGNGGGGGSSGGGCRCGGGGGDSGASCCCARRSRRGGSCGRRRGGGRGRRPGSDCGREKGMTVVST